MTDHTVRLLAVILQGVTIGLLISCARIGAALIGELRRNTRAVRTQIVQSANLDYPPFDDLGT